MRRTTHAEWLAEAEALFGKDARAWRFVCPSCGHVATLADWKAAGATEGEMAFSCVGRRLRGTTATFGQNPGPCNYAGGGLFKLNPVHVLLENGNVRETFEFAREPEKGS